MNTTNMQTVSLIAGSENLLGYLEQANVEGSMPGPFALKMLRELFNSGTPIKIIRINNWITGAITLTELPSGEFTTVTYMRGEFHNPQISTLLKESANEACCQKGKKFVVLVSPTNEKAKISMSIVWPQAEIRILDDGTLCYQNVQRPKNFDTQLVENFVELIEDLDKPQPSKK